MVAALQLPAATAVTAWTDLRATRLSWLAVALTLLVSGTGTAYSLAFLVHGDDEAAELGGTVLGLSLVGTVCATTSVTGLVVNERRQVYARWKLLGMPGPVVFLVVTGQLLVVAVAAAVPGVLLAAPLVPRAADYFAEYGAPLGQPVLDRDVALLATAVCVAAAVVGALGKALSVARVRPAVALRAGVVPTARPGVVATLWSLFMACGLVALLTSEDLRENGAVLGVQLILLVTVVPVTGWLLLVVLNWTRVLTVDRVFGPAAGIAADSTRVRSAFTAAQVLPWFLIAGMVVGIGSPMAVMLQADGGQTDGEELLVPLLAPAVVPPLVAGLATVLVLVPRVRGDNRVLLQAGASARHFLGILGWESLVVVATAGLLTVAFTVFGMATVNTVYLDDPWPADWWTHILWGPFAGILVVMWVLVVLTSAPVRLRPLRTAHW